MADASITYRTTSGSSRGSRAPSHRVVVTPTTKPASPGPGFRGYTPDSTISDLGKNVEKRWQTYHDDKLMNKLAGKRVEKKETSQLSKQKARNQARKIPAEILAKQWLSDNKATVETRAFMVDKILPTLILGIEKLLIEADGRGLTANNEHDKNFNPINYLAQYLMRNNPRYSNFSEASPYIRGLREVHEELKKQLFDYEENRLARIKAEAKSKRERREDDQRLKKIEKTRRDDCLKKQFLEWNVGYDGRIELTLLQNALRSFVEVTEHFPEELRKASNLSHELEATDETGRTMTLKEFAKYLEKYIDDMPSDVFDLFLEHMSKCALTFRAAAQREQRRVSLTNLFVSCDHSGIGLLDRHRILSLFEKFYDTSKDDHRTQLTNPRAWPVVEVDEAVVSDYSDDEDEAEQPKQAEPSSDKPGDTTTASESEAVKSGTEDSGKSSDESVEKEEKLFKTESDMGEEKAPSSQPVTAEQSTEEVDEMKDSEKSADPATEEKSEVSPKGTSDATPEQPTEPTVEVPSDTTPEAETDAAKPMEPEKESIEVATEEEKLITAEEGNEVAKEKVAVHSDGEKANTSDLTTGPATDKTPVTEQPVFGATEGDTKGEEEAPPKEESAMKETAKEETNAATEPEPSVEQNKDLDPTNEVKTVAPAGTPSVVVLGQAEGEGQTVEKPPSGGAESQKEKEVEKVPEKDDDESIEKALLDAEKGDRLEDVPLPKTPKTATEMLPPPTRGASVSFEEGTVFEKDRSHLVTRGSGSQSQMSAFDENTVNVSQFVQVTENFLGELPPQEVFQILVKFLRDGYVETEDEKMQRLLRAHREAQSAKRKYRVDHLFEKWDNDGSGYLDLDEIETIMAKYKDGQEKSAVQKARAAVKKKNPAHDSRLSKREFREFIQYVIEEIPGADTFEYFVEFLESSVERTYAERIRGEARKKWLQLIIKAAETGGASMEPIYRAVFQALYKDAETHGAGKVISASIAMLESNDAFPTRGDTVLRYVATTPDDAPYALGKCLYTDMKGISFSAVENGKPIHVPRVNNHGNIMFWRQDRNMEESDGSFIVVPLKDRIKRVFGTLGVDTLNDPHTKAIFITHEIQFFQGIAKAFSIAYHHVDNRRKTLTITESAVSWIHRRSPHVLEISVYMVEPDGKDEDYVLRKMMTTDHKGEPQPHANPARLERKDNLFRDYLFKCVDNSEAVTADAYGQRHFSFPLRDSNGMAMAVVDLSTGETKTLPKYERKEILHMLKLLQTAQKELTRESASGEKNAVLEAEMQHEDSRAEIMFDRLMLMDLKENVNKLDTRAYAELKSYKDPPKFVQNILKATLSLFYLDQALAGEFDDWNVSKSYLSTDLNQKIAAYDPTKDGALMPYEKLSEPLDDVPHGAVAKHSSVPAEFLYNWVFASLSLIQHTQRMKKNKTK